MNVVINSHVENKTEIKNQLHSSFLNLHFIQHQEFKLSQNCEFILKLYSKRLIKESFHVKEVLLGCKMETIFPCKSIDLPKEDVHVQKGVQGDGAKVWILGPRRKSASRFSRRINDLQLPRLTL